MKRIRQSKIFFMSKRVTNLRFCCPGGCRDYRIFGSASLSLKMLRLLSAEATFLPLPPLLTAWVNSFVVTNRKMKKPKERSGDSASRGRGLKWGALVFVFSRGECTGGVRRGGSWKTGRVSWKMKAVWNSGTNSCVPLAQLSLKLSSVHKALECKQVKSQNVQWSSSALDLILRSMTVTSRDVTSNWTFFKSSWLGGWHEDAQDQDHWSIYRRKIWQCPSSDKVLSAPPSTINPPSTLKERDKQQRTSPLDA